MKEISTYPEVQILSQDDFVIMANISGATNPVAIVNDNTLDELRELSKDLQEHPASSRMPAVSKLCTALQKLITPYVLVRNKYYSGKELGIERQVAHIWKLLSAFEHPSGQRIPEPPFCSFCGKGTDEVQKMVAGQSSVFICVDCANEAVNAMKN